MNELAVKLCSEHSLSLDGYERLIKSRTPELAEKLAEESSKYPLLMNPEHLSENYSAKLDMILLHDRRLATAYRLKEELRLIFKLPPEEVSAAIDK